VEQIRNGSGPMPPFKDKLTDAQIRALAHYVTEEIAPRGGGAPGN
jgi:mono/diheme cytochrome c family protein